MKEQCNKPHHVSAMPGAEEKEAQQGERCALQEYAMQR
jgi:hypothetical protein